MAKQILDKVHVREYQVNYGVPLVPIRIGAFRFLTYFHGIATASVIISGYLGGVKLEPCGVVGVTVNYLHLIKGLKYVLKVIGGVLNTNGKMVSI